VPGGKKTHLRELSWLDRSEKTGENIPVNESGFIGEMMASMDTAKFVPSDYDL
jgi:hypothetical protein